ncbi:hypothetical protein OZX62_09375 [Bifidobacterium sp. ESL0690]|uniref:YobI family P-loop NTPase n=1 Tax=Bifidobacterium sp. ESL0690 TaxID=2983214 RepID=UPI0023F8D12E|nr:hypothetical protein [Bifidobacterium sp. ESL0690]WEV46623.1 hypothetical protein OZX62_09375 [Bifidobacterium sp. ESL0690]
MTELDIKHLREAQKKYLENHFRESSSNDPGNLRPHYDPESHWEYLSKLLDALHDSENHNIALSGAYDTGKSSIIQGLQKLCEAIGCGPQVKIISLSTLAPLIAPDQTNLDEPSSKTLYSTEPFRFSGKNDDLENRHIKKPQQESTNQLIQHSIVKQLIYSNDKGPRSRYSQLHKIPNLTLAVTTIITVIIVALILLSTSTIHLIFAHRGMPGDLWVRILFFLALLIITGIITVYIMRHSKKTPSLSSIHLGNEPNSITVNNSDESYFDRYLDEIIYFFETNPQTDIIVFEDLDRFNDSEIFNNLRELNSVLNNAPKINKNQRSIRFIYCVRDSLFSEATTANPISQSSETGQTRNAESKFFDVRIPVLPFISSFNSQNYLKNIFSVKTLAPSYSLWDATKQISSTVSRYLTDMRQLKTIAHEYLIFSDKIFGETYFPQKSEHGEPTEESLLLAMVIYHSFYPEDFEKIPQRQSKLDYLYDEANRIRNEAIKETRNGINDANAILSATQKNQVSKEAEKKFFKEFNISDTDEDLPKRISRIIATLSQRIRELQKADFKELIELTSIMDSTTDADKAPQDKTNQMWEAITKTYQATSQSNLARDLLSSGYINKDYILYASMENNSAGLARRDNSALFIHHVIQPEIPDFSYELSDEAIADLQGQDNLKYDEDCTFNIFILQYLLKPDTRNNASQIKNNRKSATTMLKNTDIQYEISGREFLNEFFGNSYQISFENKTSATEIIATFSPNVFETLITSDFNSLYQKLQLINAALQVINKNNDTIKYSHQAWGLILFIADNWTDTLQFYNENTDITLVNNMTEFIHRQGYVDNDFEKDRIPKNIQQYFALNGFFLVTRPALIFALQKLGEKQNETIDCTNLSLNNLLSLEKYPTDNNGCSIYKTVMGNLPDYALILDDTVESLTPSSDGMLIRILTDLYQNTSHYRSDSATLDRIFSHKAADTQLISDLSSLISKLNSSTTMPDENTLDPEDSTLKLILSRFLAKMAFPYLQKQKNEDGIFSAIPDEPKDNLFKFTFTNINIYTDQIFMLASENAADQIIILYIMCRHAIQQKDLSAKPDVDKIELILQRLYSQYLKQISDKSTKSSKSVEDELLKKIVKNLPGELRAITPAPLPKNAQGYIESIKQLNNHNNSFSLNKSDTELTDSDIEILQQRNGIRYNDISAFNISLLRYLLEHYENSRSEIATLMQTVDKEYEKDGQYFLLRAFAYSKDITRPLKIRAFDEFTRNSSHALDFIADYSGELITQPLINFIKSAVLNTNPTDVTNDSVFRFLRCLEANWKICGTLFEDNSPASYNALIALLERHRPHFHSGLHLVPIISQHGTYIIDKTNIDEIFKHFDIRNANKYTDNYSLNNLYFFEQKYPASGIYHGIISHIDDYARFIDDNKCCPIDQPSKNSNINGSDDSSYDDFVSTLLVDIYQKTYLKRYATSTVQLLFKNCHQQQDLTGETPKNNREFLLGQDGLKSFLNKLEELFEREQIDSTVIKYRRHPFIRELAINGIFAPSFENASVYLQDLCDPDYKEWDSAVKDILKKAMSLKATLPDELFKQIDSLLVELQKDNSFESEIPEIRNELKEYSQRNH